ncbi:MAG TPA: hypothetical protein VHL80_16160 [Polyangia bacterium]|nr:hypothetical protein [Polyangia bacterium]
MIAPQACVAVQITGAPAAEERADLERRCSDILGARRCRIVAPGEGAPGGPACWQILVATDGRDPPAEASVVLSDPTDATQATVRRDVTFRANDAAAERWATLGLVIAALVTVEENSAAEAGPAQSWNAAGAGFHPDVGARRGAPPSAPSRPVDLEARASAVGALGLLPDATVGARVELSAVRGHLAVAGRATVFPGDSRVTLGGPAVAELQLWAAGLGLCGRGARGRWGGRACLGGDLARTSAHGAGVSETNTAVRWWASTWLGLSVELRLWQHLALTAEVEGAVVLVRPAFAIYGVPSTFTSSAVGGTLALGVAVPF